MSSVSWCMGGSYSGTMGCVSGNGSMSNCSVMSRSGVIGLVSELLELNLVCEVHQESLLTLLALLTLLTLLKGGLGLL